MWTLSVSSDGISETDMRCQNLAAVFDEWERLQTMANSLMLAYHLRLWDNTNSLVFTYVIQPLPIGCMARNTQQMRQPFRFVALPAAQDEYGDQHQPE